MVEEKEEGRIGEDEGKIEWKLSEDNTRAMSWGQKGLIDEFKMAVGNAISIGVVGYEVYVHSNRN